VRINANPEIQLPPGHDVVRLPDLYVCMASRQSIKSVMPAQTTEAASDTHVHKYRIDPLLARESVTDVMLELCGFLLSLLVCPAFQSILQASLRGVAIRIGKHHLLDIIPCVG
jgi:hypothetical protein